eukprot:gene5026-5518_t
MSRCPHCLQGTCRKHPLQDHGARAAMLQKKLKESSLSPFNPQSLIEAEIQRLTAKAKGTQESENDLYRRALEKDRKVVQNTLQYKDSSSSSTRDSSLSGLNPAVSSLMQRHLDSEGEEEGEGGHNRKSKKRKTRNNNSSDEESEEDDRKKKHKKESKKKKKKSSKKESKKKKKKSSGSSSKHNSRRYSDASSSSSCSSDSENDSDNNSSGNGKKQQEKDH